MSVNSTFLSTSSLDLLLLNCSDTSTSQDINTAFNITRVCLLFPLSVFILYLGHGQWRQRRSFETMSHSDMFTYHNAALELICIVGTVIYLFGIYCNMSYVQMAGCWIFSFVLCGETSFHVLTCVERYLAVVHPITYLGLRNARGVRIRNISLACAWLLSFAWSTAATLDYANFPNIQLFFPLFFSIVIVSFCSISVLCVLIRPGPGERGRDRERVDQSKQRVFLTIMAITGGLWLWFVGFAVCFTLRLSAQFCGRVMWVLRISGYWFMMSGSFMLPLLYLHRTGKICCKKKVESKN